MGVNIIIRGVLGMFFTGMIFLAMMPIIYEFSHKTDYWENVDDSRAISVRDVAWSMFLASGMLTEFAIILWMYNASTRKTASTTYE